MPDDRSPSLEPVPTDWSAAFAALPQETPDADAWQRVVRAWPRRRPRWPRWLAAAAVLAMAAMVPWRPSTETAPQPDATTPVAGHDASAPTNTEATPDDARLAATPPTDTSPNDASARQAAPAISPDEDATRPAQKRLASAGSGEGDADARDTTLSASRTDGGSRAATADARPRIASASRNDTPRASRTPATASDPASELERLQAESAQLEALVAMARDGRIATTGAAAALASRYGAQVAAIDARLIQAGIARDERVRLWRERVDAMRGLASFESTQRLLAARGERYDAMLVSID